MTSNQIKQDGKFVQLAELLCGRPIEEVPLGCDKLIKGLELESERLGDRKFLVFLARKDFDIDGLTDYVYLLESFDLQIDAINYVEAEAKSLLAKQTSKPPDACGMTWGVESVGEMPLMTPAKSGDWAHPIRVVYDRTYKLRGKYSSGSPSDYDTQYNCFRVVGPFHGKVVSEELITFVNDNWELRLHFEGVAVNRSKAFY